MHVCGVCYDSLSNKDSKKVFIRVDCLHKFGNVIGRHVAFLVNYLMIWVGMRSCVNISPTQSQAGNEGRTLSFFEECETYWRPASNREDLYQQLSQRKYREIPKHQIRSECSYRVRVHHSPLPDTEIHKQDVPLVVEHLHHMHHIHHMVNHSLRCMGNLK